MTKGSLNALIIGLVVFGTILTGSVAAISRGELTVSLMLFFLSAIIVLQVIPGLILLTAMLRELFRRPAKKSRTDAR
jgi:hypothetical protein